MASALRRTATSAVHLLVNVPLGTARLVASPFIALAGVAAFATGKDDGKLLRLAVQEAGAGTSDALCSVIGFVGTVIGAVVDPIIGKEHVREAQLYTRAALSYVGGAMPLKLKKQSDDVSAYAKFLNSISRFKDIDDIQKARNHLEGKTISKLNPAGDQLKAFSFMRKMLATYGGVVNTVSIESAREERQKLRQ